MSVVSACVDNGAAIFNQAFKRLAFRWKTGLQLLSYPRGACIRKDWKLRDSLEVIRDERDRFSG